MILNSKSNQFVFKFPKGFIAPKLEEKYNFYLKRLPTPFETITDYVNHTIQSVTFPSVNAENVEQAVGRRIDVDGKNLTKNTQIWRQSVDLDKIITKEFTVSMKAADGYLNYWVLFENFRHYLEVTNMEDYFPDMSLTYVDYEGYELLMMDFKQPLMTAISEVEMNYASTALEFKVFSVTIKYNMFDIRIKTA